MTFPLALGVCENDLRRDLSFLKSFAGIGVDLRVTPLHGGRLDAKVARLLRRQIQAALKVGLDPCAIVVHHDVDRASLEARRNEVEHWFRTQGLGADGRKLVPCVPAPCTERWLCAVLDVRVRGAKPSQGCDPWKEAWGHALEPDLDRVRRAAEGARRKLSGLEDFNLFYEAWKRAGLEPNS